MFDLFPQRLRDERRFVNQKQIGNCPSADNSKQFTFLLARWETEKGEATCAPLQPGEYSPDKAYVQSLLKRTQHDSEQT